MLTVGTDSTNSTSESSQTSTGGSPLGVGQQSEFNGGTSSLSYGSIVLIVVAWMALN